MPSGEKMHLWNKGNKGEILRMSSDSFSSVLGVMNRNDVLGYKGDKQGCFGGSLTLGNG